MAFAQLSVRLLVQKDFLLLNLHVQHDYLYSYLFVFFNVYNVGCKQMRLPYSLKLSWSMINLYLGATLKQILILFIFLSDKLVHNHEIHRLCNSL